MEIFKIFKSQRGSSLLWIMVAASLISGGAGYIMSQKKSGKDVVNTLEFENQKEHFDLYMKANLVDIDICNENFSGQNVNRAYNSLTKNNRNFVQMNNFYSGGKIYVRSIQTEPINASSFNLVLTYEKRSGQNQLDKGMGGKHFRKIYKMAGEVRPNGIIDFCYMDDNNELTALMATTFETACSGPGLIDWDPNYCHAVEIEPAATGCAKGTTAAYQYIEATGNWKIKCNSIYDEIGFFNQECAFGLKYTLEEGKFECFDLASMVDQTTVPVADNASCSIQLNPTDGRFRFSCGSP